MMEPKMETERPPVAGTTEGQPSLVEANGQRSLAQCRAKGKHGGSARMDERSRLGSCSAPTAYRAPTGRIWRYTGKRGRVLAMLATMPSGVTQWDTLPWHTRLGGTIHVVREAGLDITTELEGEYRHARYRLATPGSLLKQGKNREGAQ
ncbi:hypothetical protein T8S45_07190 [Blastomonas marina]|uniref:hypothetical protein n=1 Tax=Blastomonas marina TaxID=1867408 RepID=UPI002AC96A9A|nr:hypothetical protein [Blastomonas marina]WPZ02640.1 hypothetical protein T8S45_07190 [Blastomonas marina]